MTTVAGELSSEPSSSHGRLRALWETAPTLLASLLTVDHKKLGIRYIVTATVFLALGGIEAALMRVQLARPESRFLSPELYDQLFTLHGTTMMFLFIQPVLSGFSFYLTPLLIGARELAFPRLNTFSYYVFLLAGVFLYSSFLIGQAPDAGWFNYAPLSRSEFSPGFNIDFYALGLLYLGVSTTVGAINLIVTILKMRAPGMSLRRMPLLLWSSLTTSVSIVFALPALTVAVVLLELDRQWQFAFFDPARGGSPLLWQHLFWIFGHPWVYIVFLPATGMLSMIVPVFSRRPIVGHDFVAVATVFTGVVGFGVWMHHMFAVGLPSVSLDFFSGASMLVSLPSAVQVFAWLATIWFGRAVLKPPMLFALGFILHLVIGGITGVMTAVVPFDWQAHDTYFVVAHLHYVLAGGSLFGLFAAVYYWFPKMRGHLLDERLGRISFWIMLVGFNLTFLPMHIAGMVGMARRVYTYVPGLGLEWPNLLATIGAGIFVLGILVTLGNMIWSWNAGPVAGPDPWGANSLEWATESPPEDYNFARIPVVTSRDPLWDGGVGAGPVLDQGRWTPLSSVVESRLQRAIEMPESSAWTLVMALALLACVSGVLFRFYWIAIAGVAVTLLSMARWMWWREPLALADEL